MRDRIAVVGAGISGLVAARRRAATHDVTLYEAEGRAGGHARTVDVFDPDVGRIPVDVGFLVYNERNYPTLTRLFSELGIETAPSTMGLSVEEAKTGFVLSGDRPAALLARRRNLVDFRFWSVLFGQARFAREGARELAAGGRRSLGDFVRSAGLPQPFVDLYLLPMAAAIWSTPPRDVLDFPAAALLRFFSNHGLLTLADRPPWRTVVGGSRRYVETLLAELDVRMRLGTPVERLRRVPGGVELVAEGSAERFDRVVLALHGDLALALHEAPSRREREILGAIRYRRNETVLHDDVSLLPRNRRAWASWNVRRGDDDGGVAVTYLINKLQPLPTDHPWCVTLNRTGEIDPARIRHCEHFRHPQFDAAALAAQERWSEIDGVGGVHYAGAYWRWGFHEDGAWSGARAADAVLEAGIRRLAA